MKLHDQHVHSMYSMDSTEKLVSYIQKAIQLGCSYFVTTEHFDLDMVDGQVDWTVDYASLKQEYKKLQSQYPQISLLLGIEVGYRKTYLDQINAQIQSESYDVVNLSIHENDYADFYWPKYFEQYGVHQLLTAYFDEMIEATTHFTNYNVLSHIDYAFKTAFLMDSTLKISTYEEQIKKVYQNLITHHKALEINTKVQEAIHNDEHTRYLLQLYKQVGGLRLTLSSDAHSVDRYESSFQHYMNIIQSCGFDYLVYYIQRKEYQYPISKEDL